MPDQSQWTSRAFWQALAPALHVEDRDFILSVPEFAIDAGRAASLGERIRHEGCFDLLPNRWDVPLAGMGTLVAALAERGIPTPFAFVYDEFWLLFCQLHGMIGAVLGDQFRRLPDFWAWHVDPRKGDAGWGPHRDKGYAALRPDRSAKALTVWIPLADATPLNGCMYLVPADRDPAYGTERDDELLFDLADIRALPARAGTVFAWTQAILHWGAKTSPRESRPRISVAMEFQAGDVAPFNEPLSDPRSVPPFAERLRLIGKQILQYQHMYPLDESIRAIAGELVEA